MAIAKSIAGQTAAEYVSASEAAAHIGIQPQTLAVWRITGRYGIPFFKVGRTVRYRKSDLDAWLESRRVMHTGELAGI